MLLFRGKFKQFLFIWLIGIGILGMDTDRGVEVGVGFSQREDTREVFQIDANTHRTADVVLLHALKDFGQPPRKFRKVKMTVRVDQHPLDQSVCVGRVDSRTPPSRPSILRLAS